MVDIQNKEDIYGDLLPDVFIEKITLENSGFFPIQTNPHIDNEREEITVRKIANNLKIKLDLTIKQKLENDSLIKWLDDLDFKKYFIIKVFQVKDAKLAALAQLTKDAILVFDPATFSSSKPAVRRLFRGYLKFKDDRDLKTYCQKFVTLQKTTISNINKKLDGENTSEILDDGTEIVNTNFSLTFKNSEEQIGHLSYYAVAQFDITALIRDYKLTLSHKLSQFLFELTKVKSETVFDNFEIKGESYIYLDENSKIWNGDVHQDATGEYRSGLQETSDSIPLIKRSVNNSVIQDFRTRQQTEKLSIQFNSLQTYFNKLIKRNLGTETNFLSRTNPFFSELEVVLDKDEEVNLLFSLDVKGMAIKNSPYSYLVKNYKSVFARELAEQTKIKNLKMFRKRVKPKNTPDKFTSSTTKYEPFTKNEINELLFHVSGINETVVSNENFFLRKISNLSSPEILQFSGTDFSISSKTTGIYQYSLELEFEDPFINYINNNIEMLNRARSILLEYYSECQKTSLTKMVAEVDNPHIRSRKENEVKKYTIEGNYNPITDSFTKSFSGRMLIKYRDANSSPWILCNVVFTDIASKYLDNIEKEVFLRQLISYTSPYTGNPSGVKFVIQLIEQFLSSLEKIIKTNAKTDNTSPTARKVAKKQNSIKITNTFSNVIDLQAKPKIFLNFINNTANLSRVKNGLMTILQSEYQQRVDNEILRYYKIANPNPQIVGGTEEEIATNFETKKYSYLTPISVTDTRTDKEIEITDFTQNSLEQEIKERELRYLITSAKNGIDSTLYYKNNGTLLNIDHGLTSFNKLLLSNGVMIKNYQISTIVNNFTRETIKKAVLEESSRLNIKEQDPNNTIGNEAVVQVPNTNGPVTNFFNTFYSSYNVPPPASTSFYYFQTYQIEVGRQKEYYFAPYVFYYRGQRIVKNTRQSRWVPKYETKTIERFDSTGYVQSLSVYGQQRSSAAIYAFNLKRQLETNPQLIFDLPPQTLSYVLGDNQANLSLIPEETRENIAFVRDREDLLLGSMKQIVFQQGFEEGENGEILLNKPIWKIMTPQNLAVFPRNTEVLCRIKDFNLETKNVGFNNISNNFHISDQSFIMKVTTSTAPSLETIRGPYFEISVPNRISNNFIVIDNETNTYQQRYPSYKKYWMRTYAISETIKISKTFYDLAIRAYTEQRLYSSAFIKSSEVSRKSIEQIVNQADVSSEIRKVQQEVIANNNTPPSVSQI